MTAAIIEGGDVVFLYGGIIAGIIAVAIGVWYGKYRRKPDSIIAHTLENLRQMTWIF